MPVRILCLHGMGVDGSIFKHMTSAMRESMARNDYKFVFLNGPRECNPAPGVEDFHAGPYLCWYNTPSRERVARAHTYVKEAIDKHGGFDVVMGFSQGAALAASMLLHHELEHPGEPPLFKAAVFFSSPLPLSKDLQHGIDVRKYFGIDASKPLASGRPDVPPDYLIPQEAGKGVGTTTADVTYGFETHDKHVTEDEGGPYYNIFHPSVDEVRIPIPTAHIYGEKDPWRRHSVDLMGLCHDSELLLYEHSRGHEIPRADAEQMAAIVDELLEISEIGQ